MNYLRTTLLRNTEKYLVEDVIDYDKVSSKWDFLKMDVMKWDNFLDARSMGLVRDSERVVCEEHLSSIENSIHGVAKIYSISLNQCYRRKKVLGSLENNEKKFQDLIADLDKCIGEYNKELSLVDQHVAKIEGVKYIQDNDGRAIFFSFRKEINQLEKRNQEEIKGWIQFFNCIVTNLTSVKIRVEKHYNQLKQSMDKMKERLDKEVEIMQKALAKMNAMRDQYLYSFVFYNKLISTKEETSIQSSSNIGSEDAILEEESLSL